MAFVPLQLTKTVEAIRACKVCEPELPLGANPIVQAFEEYLPEFLPIPHPSPLNNVWLSRNPWFEKTVLPILQETVARILKESEENLNFTASN